MATWDEIRDEVAGMLADGQPLEDVISKLEKRKNEMAKANLLKAMNDMKKIEQTNEDWFCSLSTEEKAEWLFETFDLCGAGCSNCFVQKWCFVVNDKMPTEMFVEWLKQPHTPKE